MAERKAPSTTGDPADPATFEVASWLWRRRYRVDDEGIAVFGWDGSFLASIRWDQLQRVGEDTIRSADGDRIKVRLDAHDKYRLLAFIRTRWRARHPDAWREDLARKHRTCRWILFVYLPAVSFGGVICKFELMVLLGCLPGSPEQYSRLATALLAIAVFVAGYWLMYFFWLRHSFDESRHPS